MVDPIDVRRALSAREIACLRALATGKTDSEAAKELGISQRTVRFHIDAVKAKLGVATRVQAVAKALRDKIVICGTWTVTSLASPQAEAALLNLAYV